MRIVISSKNTDISPFIYNYLPNYIYKLFVTSVDADRLNIFNKELNVNTFNILSYLLKALTVSRINANKYDISINKNIKIDNTSANSYINFITYGNRSIKGYPILYDIFNYVAKNIEDIYDEYERGG